jgi:hypothetical protein
MEPSGLFHTPAVLTLLGEKASVSKEKVNVS